MRRRRTTRDLIAIEHARPAARSEGLLTTDAGDEVVVYDRHRQHIHHLNRVSAMVWRHCDGEHAISRIATSVEAALNGPLEDGGVYRALTQLEDANLLTQPLHPDIRLKGTMSRRSLLKTAATVGAASVPAIVSISAPSAAAAASTTSECGVQNSTCTVNSDCCSGWCNKEAWEATGTCG